MVVSSEFTSYPIPISILETSIPSNNTFADRSVRVLNPDVLDEDLQYQIEIGGGLFVKDVQWTAASVLLVRTYSVDKNNMNLQVLGGFREHSPYANYFSIPGGRADLLPRDEILTYSLRILKQPMTFDTSQGSKIEDALQIFCYDSEQLVPLEPIAMTAHREFYEEAGISLPFSDLVEAELLGFWYEDHRLLIFAMFQNYSEYGDYNPHEVEEDFSSPQWRSFASLNIQTDRITLDEELATNSTPHVKAILRKLSIKHDFRKERYCFRLRR